MPYTCTCAGTSVETKNRPEVGQNGFRYGRKKHSTYSTSGLASPHSKLCSIAKITSMLGIVSLFAARWSVFATPGRLNHIANPSPPRGQIVIWQDAVQSQVGPSHTVTHVAFVALHSKPVHGEHPVASIPELWSSTPVTRMSRSNSFMIKLLYLF